VVTAEHLSRLHTAADFVELLLRLRSSLIITGGAADLDWYADSEPDKTDGVKLLKGWDAVREAIRFEQETVARSMLERAPHLSDAQEDVTQLLIDANNALHAQIATAKSQDDVDAWDAVLDAMLDLGAVGVAILHSLMGWKQDQHELVASVQPFAPNVRHVGTGTRLFEDLVTYYSLETDNGEELDHRSAAMGLVGLLIEAHWRLAENLREAAAQAD